MRNLKPRELEYPPLLVRAAIILIFFYGMWDITNLIVNAFRGKICGG